MGAQVAGGVHLEGAQALGLETPTLLERLAEHRQLDPILVSVGRLFRADDAAPRLVPSVRSPSVLCRRVWRARPATGRRAGAPARSRMPLTMSHSPATDMWPPLLLLASTSPQRRAILEQLGIPFDVVPPRYEEHDRPDADVVELVREHARGKARSVAGGAGDQPVLGVDTAVSLGGAILGKPANAAEAERMLGQLSGQTHTVVSGLCLTTPGWEVVEHEETH